VPKSDMGACMWVYFSFRSCFCAASIEDARSNVVWLVILRNIERGSSKDVGRDLRYNVSEEMAQ
jgi:hypothetical protein